MVVLNIIGCSKEPVQEETIEELRQVEKVQGFSSINGYKVQEGKFFFTGIKKNQWNLYRLDLENEDLKAIHPEAENYDVYIALGEDAAVYIDLDGQLFYRTGEEEKRIDDEIMGIQRPNLLVSPSQEGVLYTKGPLEEADLYLYFFQQDEPVPIKKNISQDAFRTFSFTTQWSNKNNYFIYHNQEIYNDKGELYTTIDATTALWSPDDNYIAYIKIPEAAQEKEITIGHWNTYIGEELALLNVEEKKAKTIYENSKGLIDPIDSLQWSKNAAKIGVSVGDITITPHKELDELNYEKVYVYDVAAEEGMEVENIHFNYYEILFDNYLYASSIGKKEVLELVEIYEKDRKKYNNPALLNSQDMFVISHQKEGYLLDGRKLIKLNQQGEEEVIFQGPWEINEVYLDTKTKTFIITNEEMEMYLLKK